MAKERTLIELVDYLTNVRDLGKSVIDANLLYAIADFIELDRGNRGSGLLKINTNSEKKSQ